jgi:hypothetical protein
VVRRSLSRLAWYFGIAWGDPGYPETTTYTPPKVWRLLVGWLAAATVFAAGSEAVGGFEGGVTSSVARGAGFATALLAFNLLMARAQDVSRSGKHGS